MAVVGEILDRAGGVLNATNGQLGAGALVMSKAHRRPR